MNLPYEIQIDAEKLGASLRNFPDITRRLWIESLFAGMDTHSYEMACEYVRTNPNDSVMVCPHCGKVSFWMARTVCPATQSCEHCKKPLPASDHPEAKA